ncbi:MAG: hypothetical protein J5I93_06695 [Pirellulaceae bacterium]|nr:hypothetical protein [Pirellulaceae bacterium]
MSSTSETYDDLILAGLQGALSPEAAEGLLALRFSDEQQQRMSELAAKARAGELPPKEREESDSFERVSSLLGILQSRARISFLCNAACSAADSLEGTCAPDPEFTIRSRIMGNGSNVELAAAEVVGTQREALAGESTHAN